MDLLGCLRHTNLVSLKAYYNARDEKLLVYEYMENESLYSVLHGKSTAHSLLSFALKAISHLMLL